MDVLTDLVGTVVGAQCANTLLVEQQFLDVPCLKLLVSKGLSYAIIVGALICEAAWRCRRAASGPLTAPLLAPAAAGRRAASLVETLTRTAAPQ